MAARQELPRLGDKIKTELFHISKMNVRYGHSFGESESDKKLIAQLRRGRIVGPFKARPENEGYGVVVGRRRFLAKKVAGAEFFEVGKDCTIEMMTDEEAREASLVENLSVLRKEMDPVTRAEVLNELISNNPAGLRSTARHLGMSASTLAEWRKPLALSVKMQEAVRRDLLTFSDSLELARLELSKIKQNELAEIVENEGVEAYRKELSRFLEKKKKRGPSTDKFETIKTMWDKRDTEDMEPYKVIAEAAESRKMKVPEYIKDFLKRHLDEIKREIS